MNDKRFEDRLKRIAARTAAGGPVEMLAGVGEISEAKKAVEADERPRASLMLAVLGAIVGFAAFRPLRDTVSLEMLTTLPPDMLLDIAMEDPTLGIAAGILGVCALLCVLSLLRGRKAYRVMSFSYAALGAALGGAIMPFG